MVSVVVKGEEGEGRRVGNGRSIHTVEGRGMCACVKKDSHLLSAPFASSHLKGMKCYKCYKPMSLRRLVRTCISCSYVQRTALLQMVHHHFP